MSGQGPRGIGELLQSTGLARLRSEATARRELAARVRSALPEAQALHVVSANLDEGGYLVIGMDSAAWAARLRYSTATLLGIPLRVRVAVPGQASD